MTGQTPNHQTDRSHRWRSFLAERGLSQVESGRKKSDYRVTRLEIAAGLITANVADKQLGDCDVRIQMPVWRDEQWTDVIELLSRQALYAAQLLAGDFPMELESTLQREGLALLPAPHETIRATCSCSETSEPASTAAQAPAGAMQTDFCRHAIAALHGAGELLSDDPWLLFLLRGRVREQVLRTLRRKRGQSGEANGATFAERAPQQEAANAFNGLRGDAQSASGAPSLADELHSFWGSARTQQQFRPQVAPPVAELILLRRLGPPAFSHANREVFDALASVYSQVREAALALAYDEDPPATDGASWDEG